MRPWDSDFTTKQASKAEVRNRVFLIADMYQYYLSAVYLVYILEWEYMQNRNTTTPTCNTAESRVIAIIETFGAHYRPRNRYLQSGMPGDECQSGTRGQQQS